MNTTDQIKHRQATHLLHFCTCHRLLYFQNSWSGRQSRYHIASHLAMSTKIRTRFLTNICLRQQLERISAFSIFASSSLGYYRKRSRKRQLWALSSIPAIRSRDKFLHQASKSASYWRFKDPKVSLPSMKLYPTKMVFARSSIRVTNDPAGGQTWKKFLCHKLVGDMSSKQTSIKTTLAPPFFTPPAALCVCEGVELLRFVNCRTLKIKLWVLSHVQREA